jgi:hypothetical protein
MVGVNVFKAYSQIIMSVPEMYLKDKKDEKYVLAFHPEPKISVFRQTLSRGGVVGRPLY